jgi:hypothetical protein
MEIICNDCVLPATAQGSDVIITNRNAGGATWASLPLAKKGMRLAFYNVAGSGWTLYRSGSDTLYYTTTDYSVTGWAGLNAKGTAAFCYAPWDAYWQCGQ